VPFSSFRYKPAVYHFATSVSAVFLVLFPRGGIRMCLRFVVLAAIVAGWIWPAVAEQAFPYKAYITADDTYVRSGPGESHYPTGKLKAGAKVEVYRHDPGGWYAIRPPEGSFSWVGSRFVKPTRNGLGEITGERVAVRVGSQLSEKRDAVQVRVTRGEIVEVLGTEQTGTGRQAGTWWKIGPPSGEFRWVHGSEVDSSPPGSGASKAGKELPSLTAATKPAEPVSTKPPETKPADKWTPAAGNPTASPPGPVAATPVAATPVAPVAPSPSGQETPRVPPAALRQRTSEEFQKEMDDINTELSIMLAEEPSAWKCEELGRRARALQDQAQSAVERGNARMLVNRIAQSEDVKRRYLAMNATATETNRKVRLAADRSRAAGTVALSPGSAERFDGVGRLTRVLPPKLGAPRYALVDEQGAVKSYVSPAPGVSMQFYLGRQVGINGVRGYVAEQNAELLTAKHVTALDTQLR
jgi:hypothetical protein